MHLEHPHVVKVDLAGAPYEIRIGVGFLPHVGLYAQELRLGNRVLVVTDENVEDPYLGFVVQSLQSHGFSVATHVIPEGEPSKSIPQLDALWQAAVQAGLDRRSFVVALGGGVVGDLAGFLAATLFRGIPLIQIPTSLLAMVDSSVGGKTGINLPQGKNLVGAFHQPVLVLADLAVIETLPAREYAAGMAEVIKYGAIQDRAFFEWLEQEREDLRSRDLDDLARIVRRSCEIKAAIVAADEKENAERAFLNFGHTLGHAVENVGGYGRFLHGEAIAIGQHYAARLSSLKAGLPSADAQRIRDLLQAFDLPVHGPELEWDALLQAMRVDKKARDGAVRFVLLPELGRCALPVPVAEADLAAVWREVAANGQAAKG